MFFNIKPNQFSPVAVDADDFVNFSELKAGRSVWCKTRET